MLTLGHCRIIAILPCKTRIASLLSCVQRAAQSPVGRCRVQMSFTRKHPRKAESKGDNIADEDVCDLLRMSDDASASPSSHARYTCCAQTEHSEPSATSRQQNAASTSGTASATISDDRCARMLIVSYKLQLCKAAKRFVALPVRHAA
jgi:hypothetical protein